MDSTKGKGNTAQEASDAHAAHYKTLTLNERLRIAHYLNSIAYRFDPMHPPKMDRTKFLARSRANGQSV